MASRSRFWVPCATNRDPGSRKPCLSEIDLDGDTALDCGSNHCSRNGKILQTNAGSIEKRDLIIGGPPRMRSVDHRTELDNASFGDQSLRNGMLGLADSRRLRHFVGENRRAATRPASTRPRLKLSAK